MATPDPGGFAQFLNYGGLGLLAILCLVVLGYNVWSLNALVAKAEPKRITSARPLLLAHMGVSLIGLLAVGFGAIYLESITHEWKRKQRAQVLINPWNGSMAPAVRPAVQIGDKAISQQLVEVLCTPETPATVRVDFDPFINHVLSEARAMQQVLPPLTDALGAE